MRFEVWNNGVFHKAFDFLSVAVREMSILKAAGGAPTLKIL